MGEEERDQSGWEQVMEELVECVDEDGKKCFVWIDYDSPEWRRFFEDMKKGYMVVDNGNGR